MTSQTQPSSQTSRPQGYLKEEFRFFHLKDLGKGPYEYHHHDFLKILILINGNVYILHRRPLLSPHALGYGVGGPGPDPPS